MKWKISLSDCIVLVKGPLFFESINYDFRKHALGCFDSKFILTKEYTYDKVCLFACNRDAAGK